MNNQLLPLQGPLQLGWTGPLVTLEGLGDYIAEKGILTFTSAGEQTEEEHLPPCLPIILDSLSSSLDTSQVEVKVAYQLDRLLLIDGNISILSVYLYLFFYRIKSTLNDSKNL